MGHPLEVKLGQLRRAARRYALIQAAARAVAFLLLAILVIAIADWLIHLQDRGLRLLGSSAVLAAFVWGCYSVRRAVLRSQYRLVDLAKIVEHAHPATCGNLASAIEFLATPVNAPYAGSAVLRRAVIHDASARVAEIDIQTVLDPRPSRRALAVAGATMAAVMLALVLDPHAARTAAWRLANPFNNVAWPRAHTLAYAQTIEQLAAGQTFEIEVIDRQGAPLPDDTVIRYRFTNADGEIIEETEPLQVINGTLLARRENVQRPFDYRVAGGDDDTLPWITLEVIEPPALQDLGLQLHFPAYTGWPVRVSDPQVKALIGTRIAVHGTASKPLSAATLRSGETLTIPAMVGKDGEAFDIPAEQDEPFLVRENCSYWFDLVDRANFRSAPRPEFDLQAVADASPTITIERPQANVFLTADATLPLSITARDDLALQQVTLVYLRGDASEAGEEILELLAGPPRVTPETALASAAEGYAGDEHTIEFQWELSALKLPPGTQLTFHATALDYADQTGQSLPRRLTIVTPAQMQERFAERQATIYQELGRVLELQQTARAHVSGIDVQIQQAGQIKAADIDLLQGAGLNQQQVERELSRPGEGLRGQIEGLLDELAINKIDGPDTQRQMRTLLGNLDELSQNALPNAARDLTAATKSLQVGLQEAGGSTTAPSDAARQAISSVGTAQQQVVRSLEQMMDDLRQWVNYRQFHREVSQLATAQEEVATATTAAGQKTLSRAVEDLDPQQQADLQRLAQRQLEVARRLDRLEQQLAQTAATAREEDPLAADAMTDALSHARNQGLSETMRESGQDIARNKIGKAVEAQRTVTEQLQELQDILANRREHELGRLVKKLREAEAAVEDLATRQAGLTKKLREAEQLSEPERKRELQRLAREQEQLQADAQRTARTLARLQAEASRDRLGDAGSKMQQAAEKSADGNAAAAGEQSSAAERDLAEAQQNLAAQRKQAESDLAQERLIRTEDTVAGLHARQQKLMAETVHYQLRQADRGHLTRAEAASVRDLARQQQALHEEGRELAKVLGGAEVFQFVIEVIGRDMAAAAARLDRRELDNETVRHEASAVARLEQLLTALKSDSPAAKDDAKQGEESGEQTGAEDGAKPRNQVRSVAELKLLRAVQEQINQRTAALDAAAGTATAPPPDAQREYAALSEEQGRLAQLIDALFAPVDERPEDNPDSLPDVRQPSPTSQAPNSLAPAGLPEAEQP